jgi:hypothetical protein
MLSEMTWDQLLEWHEYAQLEPFGEERADLRSGIITANIVNVLIAANTDPKKRPKLYKPSDFMPDFKKINRKVELMDQESWNDFKQYMIATAK